MTPEQYFFNYAFPCAQVLLDLKKIDQRTYDELKKLFYENQAPSRYVLEKIFASAIRRLKSIAEKVNKDYWDIDIIKKYFHEQHNHFIDMKEGDYEKFGENFRGICKVHVAEVIEKKGNVLTVKNSKTIRKILGDKIAQARVGDRVTVHLGFGIEIL